MKRFPRGRSKEMFGAKCSLYFIVYRQGQRIAPGRSTPMSAG